MTATVTVIGGTDRSGSYDYADNDDPRHLVFSLARYKFVAKMLEGKGDVLEVGCGDGFKSRIVRQAVGHLTGIDGDVELIARACRNRSERFPIEFLKIGDERVRTEGYDAVYTLDVLEHVKPEDEGGFLAELRAAAPVCVIGMPSLESQAHASPRSKTHHVNCKTRDELRRACLGHWRQVFMFGMNDEVVHTGFGPMCQYLFALCVA